MKRTIYTTALIFSLISCALGQLSIPNGGFEEWENVRIATDNSIIKYLKPIGWEVESGFTEPIVKDSGFTVDVHSGGASLMLYNRIDKLEQNIIKLTFSCSQKPHHISFWSKTSGYDGRPFIIEAELYDNSGTKVAQGYYSPNGNYFAINSETNDYQRSFIVLDYFNDLSPDSATIKIISASKNDYPKGSQLFIDSMSFSSYSVGVEKIEHGLQETNWSVTPNPVQGREFTINLSKEIINEVSQIDIIDIQGNVIMRRNMTTETHHSPEVKFNVASLIPGVYTVSVKQRGIITAKRIVITH